MKEERELGYKALTTVAMKSSIFWDTTPCSLVKVNRLFGRKYRLHLQDRRVNQTRNPEDGCDMFLRNNGWLSADYRAVYPK
jgi:hypothetical protein